MLSTLNQIISFIPVQPRYSIRFPFTKTESHLSILNEVFHSEHPPDKNETSEEQPNSNDQEVKEFCSERKSLDNGKSLQLFLFKFFIFILVNCFDQFLLYIETFLFK